MPPTAQLLAELERYYDEVPRATAVIEEIGPFTLFLKGAADGWSFYARPRLGDLGRVTATDVERVLVRQREVRAPEQLEWVAETTPGLEDAVVSAGLEVEHYPLMVLPEAVDGSSAAAGVEMLTADDERIPGVQAVVEAAFAGTDEVGAAPHVDGVRRGIDAGTLRLAGAFDGSEAVGGGTHSPRGSVTELMGIGVLPRARRRGTGAAITATLVTDARQSDVETIFLSAGSQQVADIYGRVGFRTVATACIAGPRP